MRKSKNELLEQISAKNPYVTFFLGHPVHIYVQKYKQTLEPPLTPATKAAINPASKNVEA